VLLKISTEQLDTITDAATEEERMTRDMLGTLVQFLAE
jgi:hypothetical protein